jgi:hypothetical protein
MTKQSFTLPCFADLLAHFHFVDVESLGSNVLEHQDASPKTKTQEHSNENNIPLYFFKIIFYTIKYNPML